jgi:hypothetical protein
MAKVKKEEEKVESVESVPVPIQKKHYCKRCRGGFNTFTEHEDYCPRCKRK